MPRQRAGTLKTNEEVYKKNIKRRQGKIIMKLKRVENKANLFSLDRYTDEQKAVFKKQDETKKRAEEFFKAMYDQSTALVIVANVMVAYHNIYTGWAETFEQAWNTLGYEITTDIVYRAVNGLPARSKKEEVKA